MINAIRNCAASAYYTVETVCSKTTAFATALFKVISSPKSKIYTSLALCFTASVILPVAAADKLRVKSPCCGNDFFLEVMIIISHFVSNKALPWYPNIYNVNNFKNMSVSLIASGNFETGCGLLMIKEVKTVFDSSISAEARMLDLELLHTNCHFNETALIERLYEENIRLQVVNFTELYSGK